MCMYVHFAWKGCLRNDLYCVRRDVKPYRAYTLTFSQLFMLLASYALFCLVCYSSCCNHLSLKSFQLLVIGFSVFVIQVYILTVICIGGINYI